MARYLLERVFARIGQCQELLLVVRDAKVELQRNPRGVSRLVLLSPVQVNDCEVLELELLLAAC